MPATLGRPGPGHTTYAVDPPWAGEGPFGYWRKASEELWDGTFKWELLPKRPMMQRLGDCLKAYYLPAITAQLNRPVTPQLRAVLEEDLELFSR